MTAALAVAALGYAYSGLFSRYVADDFCSASVLAQHGLMGAQTFWYQNWSGRFTFVLVIDLLNALGAWTVPLTPPLLLVAWVAAAAAAVHPWLRQLFGIQARAWSPLLALLLVVASLGSAPAVWEDLYWQTGAVTYLMPIVLSLAFAATLWRVRSAVLGGRPYWPWIGLGAIMIAIAAGCSETAMAALVCALGLAAVAVAWRARGPARRPVAFGVGLACVAAVVVSAVVIAAPGNAVRLTYFSHPPLILAVAEMAWFPLFWAFNLIVHAPIYVLLAYAIPRLIAQRAERSSNRHAVARRLLLAAGYLTIAASGAPAFYVGGAIPPPRAQMIPQVVLIAILMGCGFLDGLDAAASAQPTRLRAWRGAARRGVCALLIILGPLVSALRIVDEADGLQAYAASLDALDHQARQAHDLGRASLVVDPLPKPDMVGIEDIGADPSAGPNSCMAEYYGVASIATRD